MGCLADDGGRAAVHPVRWWFVSAHRSDGLLSVEPVRDDSRELFGREYLCKRARRLFCRCRPTLEDDPANAPPRFGTNVAVLILDGHAITEIFEGIRHVRDYALPRCRRGPRAPTRQAVQPFIWHLSVMDT
jgi:hypothetical protein